MKFQVLAAAKGWADEDPRMTNFPLYLERDAFRVYSRPWDVDQKKEAEVKVNLLSAFSVTPSRAFELFKRRVFRADKSVDAQVADLQRLLALSGSKHVDAIVIKQLIEGQGIFKAAKAVTGRPNVESVGLSQASESSSCVSG